MKLRTLLSSDFVLARNGHAGAGQLRVGELRVSNFRSLREAVLQCDDLTVLVGRNGAGKSSFLHALEAFYTLGFSITQEDFFERDVETDIEISIAFWNLTDKEETEFAAYASGGMLEVTKRISWISDRPVQKYYARAKQIPQFASIRGFLGKNERRQALVALIGAGELPGLQGSPKSADAAETLMAEYESTHPELMEGIEREAQFFGAPNVGGGKLDKYTRFLLVPAVREAASEASGRAGAAQQLIETLVMRKIAARADVQKLQSNIAHEIATILAPENLKELHDLSSSLSKALQQFAPGAGVNLQWGEVAVPEIIPPPTRLTLIEDSFEGDVERKGHGLQRALIVTLLRQLAMLGESEGGAGPSLLLAIEEPELHLHPTRCRYLADLLRDLAVRQGEGARNQVIVTTHSPHFVDLYWFDSVRVVRKKLGDRPIPESLAHRYLMTEAANRLAHISGRDPGEFNRDSFRARTSAIMTVLVNEGFFAETAMLVEGPSEAGAFWQLQDTLDLAWAELGISLIPVGGKNNFDRLAVVFGGLKIPTYVLFDFDGSRVGGPDEASHRVTNTRLLRLLAAERMDAFQETQISSTWAGFRTNLEGALQDDIGRELLDEVREQVSREVTGGQADLKNPVATAALVRLIYSRGATLPTFEEIARRVTELAANGGA